MVEILGLRGQLPPEAADKVQKIARPGDQGGRACCASSSRSPGATGVSRKVELQRRGRARDRAAALLPVARPRHGDAIDAPATSRWSPGPTASRRPGAREPDHQRRGSGRRSRTSATIRIRAVAPRRRHVHCEFSDSARASTAERTRGWRRAVLDDQDAGRGGPRLAVAQAARRSRRRHASTCRAAAGAWCTRVLAATPKPASRARRSADPARRVVARRPRTRRRDSGDAACR